MTTIDTSAAGLLRLAAQGRMEKTERLDRPERKERPEKTERPERKERPDRTDRAEKKDHMHETVAKLMRRMNHMAEKNGVKIPPEALRNLAAKMTADGKLDADDRKIFNDFLTRLKNHIAGLDKRPDARLELKAVLEMQKEKA